MSPGGPGWRNWSDARRSKRRGLRAMWVRVPPRVPLSVSAAAAARRPDVDDRSHPRVDHALEPRSPGCEAAHGEGSAREHGARVRERIERRAVDALARHDVARHRLAVVERAAAGAEEGDPRERVRLAA